jgi:hypothetical protein
MRYVVKPHLRFFAVAINLLQGTALSMYEMKCLPLLEHCIACFHLSLVHLLNSALKAPILEPMPLVSISGRSFLLLFFPSTASLAALSMASLPSIPLCPGCKGNTPQWA